MSGIAFILPNADFSDSPLGKVTRKKSNHEKAVDVVTAYSQSISDSSHNDALITLVEELMNLNVWDKLDVYPVLGSSLSDKLINLNPEGFTGEDCVIGANASNGTDCVSFVNTLSMGEVTTVTKGSDSVNDIFFLYYDAKYNYVSINSSMLLNYQRVAGGSGIVVGTAVNSGRKNYIYYHSSSKLWSNLSADSRAKITFGVDATNKKFYVINDGAIEESNVGEDVTKYNITNLVGGANGTGSGGESIAASNDLYNGDVYMLVKGDVPKDKFIEIKTLLDTFLTTVKPIV